MKKILDVLRYLPDILKRIGHVIHHILCDVDDCEGGYDNA